MQEKHAARYYQACQTGPAIYDSTGGLIWSGACTSKNQNTCDFRAFEANGSMYMSAIFAHYPAKDFVGRGVIFDNSM
ncbi:hypothetical protein Slin14017_G126940 [Septoria linicola]|nr:hypothetical protein Slin14017_G126940 [Septoria linicola]